jgi:hypothetical protein
MADTHDGLDAVIEVALSSKAGYLVNYTCHYGKVAGRSSLR